MLHCSTTRRSNRELAQVAEIVEIAEVIRKTNSVLKVLFPVEQSRNCSYYSHYKWKDLRFESGLSAFLFAILATESVD